MQAPKFTRNYDFTVDDGDKTAHAKINSELDAAALSVNQLRVNQALVQKDDGSLKVKIVKAENLADDAFQSVTADVISAKEAARVAANKAELAAAQATAMRQTNSKILPASTVDPTERPDKSALEFGDIYLNTSVNELRVYKTSGWASFNEVDSYSTSETYNKSEVYNKTETLSASEIAAAIGAYSYAKASVYTKDEVDSKLPRANAATGLWDIGIAGNSATSTKLKTSINIGGVPFDGSASIDLPGVNKPSNYPLDKDLVLAAISKAPVGGVGTYAFLKTSNAVDTGSNISGSVLSYSGITSANTTTTLQIGQNLLTPSGTWRCMGVALPGGTTLWLRIA